jgi:hypothetical protein
VTTIPLAPVVTFLRKRGALSVLEGAPVLGPARDPFFCSALTGASLVELAGPSELRGSHLYLGTSDVCHAAEGWASRVLALARGALPVPVWVGGGPVSVVLFFPMSGARIHGWKWGEFQAGDTMMMGSMPRTPAERLRAVLLHELERA